MKRRDFIQKTGLLTLPLFVNGWGVRALANSALSNFVNNESDRVLVLIQLNGGNDGLNMLVPLDQYDNLAQVRSNVILPENSLLQINPTNALHASMNGIQDIYNDGRVAFLQGVGYPDQNRSHFRSTDIWTTGSPSNEFWDTGWLGRYFQEQAPNFPTDFPNGDFPDPFAVTIGPLVSETCQGEVANFSLAITDPFNLGQLASGGTDTAPNTPYGSELSFLRTAISQTNAYATVISDAADMGNNQIDYPEDNALAQQLKTVARLVSGGLKTKVYICNLGGFDTHADQVTSDSPLTGDHAELLKTMSDAVSLFQRDVEALGIGNRVLGMTFSEFGRRIRSNFSLGTDHGSAAPMMLFGTCLNAGIHGANPTIDTQVDEQEGVAMEFDFRNVYGSILQDWFDVPEAQVRNLLFADYQHIEVVDPCLVNSTSNPLLETAASVSVFPNPFQGYAKIQFTSPNDWVRISVHSLDGKELQVISNQRFIAGRHVVDFEGRNLPKGVYFIQVKVANKQPDTVRVVRV